MSALVLKSESERKLTSLKAIGWQMGIHSYAWSPPTDMYETDAAFIVRVEVAGMRRSDFSIDIEENLLVISGARSDSPERRGYHQMEIRFGEFSTAVELPPGVDVTKTEAEYDDGFLTIVLPKIKPVNVAIG
jgi:HSP20 family protein